MHVDLKLCDCRGSIDEIEFLLAAGGNPRFCDPLHGGTCLHSAAARGDVSILRLLLEAGADPNVVTQNTETSPLGIAALSGNEKAVRLLIGVGGELSHRELSTELTNEVRDIGYKSIANLLEAAI